MTIINVTAFQPFESRRGLDTVLRVTFAYDPAVVATLKDAIRSAKEELGGSYLGGWLAEHKSWFVEREAWPIVRRYLQWAGYTIIDHGGEGESRSHANGGSRSHANDGSRVPAVRSVVKSWYREMAMKYHPDRTLDNGSAMKAINHGYERLQELFGIQR